MKKTEEMEVFRKIYRGFSGSYSGKSIYSKENWLEELKRQVDLICYDIGIGNAFFYDFWGVFVSAIEKTAYFKDGMIDTDKLVEEQGRTWIDWVSFDFSYRYKEYEVSFSCSYYYRGRHDKPKFLQTFSFKWWGGEEGSKRYLRSIPRRFRRDFTDCIGKDLNECPTVVLADAFGGNNGLKKWNQAKTNSVVKLLLEIIEEHYAAQGCSVFEERSIKSGRETIQEYWLVEKDGKKELRARMRKLANKLYESVSAMHSLRSFGILNDMLGKANMQKINIPTIEDDRCLIYEFYSAVLYCLTCQAVKGLIYLTDAIDTLEEAEFPMENVRKLLESYM